MSVKIDNAYFNVHKWLVRNFGNPEKCSQCLKIGEKWGRRWNIEWALKKGSVYEKNKNNFFGLCKKCHRKYDDSAEWRNNMSIAAKKSPYNNFFGKRHTQATKDSIRKKKIGRKRPDVAERNKILKTKTVCPITGKNKSCGNQLCCWKKADK